MSGSVTGPLRLDETASPAAEYGNQANVQQELDSSQNTDTSTSTMTLNQPRMLDSTMDISAGQKMLSAVSGSLLTSLLGMAFIQMTFNQSMTNPTHQ